VRVKIKKKYSVGSQSGLPIAHFNLSCRVLLIFEPFVIK